MSAAAVLAELRSRGIRVRASSGGLHVSPPEALTPELRARILAETPALLALLEPPSLDQTVARREVLCWPAILLAELPLPTTLELAAGEAFTVATHLGCSARTTWCPAEWLALVIAAEHERAYPHTFGTWLARKHADPGWMLTEGEALGLPASQPPRGWSVERVLHQLGAVLRGVRIDGGES